VGARAPVPYEVGATDRDAVPEAETKIDAFHFPCGLCYKIILGWFQDMNDADNCGGLSGITQKRDSEQKFQCAMLNLFPVSVLKFAIRGVRPIFEVNIPGYVLADSPQKLFCFYALLSYTVNNTMNRCYRQCRRHEMI